MSALVKPFAAGLVTFLALDLVWIGLLANQFYKRELAGLARMADQLRHAHALLAAATVIDMCWGAALSAVTAATMAWVAAD